MKAAVLTQYDKNGRELEIRELPIPEPGADEVLVKVMAAAVNPLDNMIMRGEVKMIVSYKMPLVMGNEFAGIVEKTGKNATRLQVGDRVYGRMPLKKIGAFAEYAAVREDALARIPEYLSFEEAATVPLTALTAMQAFEIMKVKAGESVFISGGTGSLGAMAIPVAKSLGLHVYTNGSGDGDNEARVKRLGAEKFIDYKKARYVDQLSDVDHVLDTLGDRELPDEFSILKRAEVWSHCGECRTDASRREAVCRFGSAFCSGLRGASMTRWLRPKTRAMIFCLCMRAENNWKKSESCLTEKIPCRHRLTASIRSIGSMRRLPK